MNKNKAYGKRVVSKYLFIYGVWLYPLLNFLVFYVYTRVDGVLDAFRNTDINFNQYWCGFDNFKMVFDEIFKSKILLRYSFHSFLFWFWTLIIGMPLNLLFAYIMIIKARGSDLLQALMMIPCYISGLVTAMVFSKFFEKAMPILFDEWFNIKTISLLRDERYNLETLIVYVLLTGFSSQVIIYMNAMKGSGESLFEVAKLEGANHVQTMWHVCMPPVYQIIAANVVVSVPSIIAGDPGLYAFYEYNAPESVITTGYYLFTKTKNSNPNIINYNYGPALNILITVICYPTSLLVRYLFDRFDPNREA